MVCKARPAVMAGVKRRSEDVRTREFGMLVIVTPAAEPARSARVLVGDEVSPAAGQWSTQQCSQQRRTAHQVEELVPDALARHAALPAPQDLRGRKGVSALTNNSRSGLLARAFILNQSHQGVAAALLASVSGGTQMHAWKRGSQAKHTLARPPTCTATAGSDTTTTHWQPRQNL